MQPIHNSATVTSKGQITLPKFVRQTLGVDAGSKLDFVLQDGAFIVRLAAEAPVHYDPAISAFLSLLEQDIAQGRHIGSLHADIIADMQAVALANSALQPDIEGEVCL